MSKYKYKKSYRTIKKKSAWIIFKNKFFWLGILVLIIFSGLIYLFIFSSVFQIKQVQISGTEKAPNQEIKDIISANVKNIFLTDLEIISRNILEQYPQIVNVTFKKKLPDRILVEVKERKPALVFCQTVSEPFLKFSIQKDSNNCFFADIEGIIFEKIDQSDRPELLLMKSKASIYRFYLGQEIINKDYLEKILKISSQLKNNIQISEASLISEERLDIKTLEGWEIYFSFKKDIDWQIEQLDILLKEKISLEDRENLEYIDLRFDKIYIKRVN